MIKKLKVKFVIINMVIVTILLSVILSMVFYFTRARMENQSIKIMQQVAQDTFRPPMPSEDDSEIRLPYFVVQLGPQGERLAVNGGYFDLSSEQMLDELISRTKQASKRMGVLKSYNLRYCLIDTPRSQYLVFVDISNELATLHNLMAVCLLIGLVGFAGFLLASILLSGWAVRPVEKAMERQKKFVGDASHELKTPLTVITTNAQILDSCFCGNPQDEMCISNILTMSAQMKHLLQQMLTLSRADSGMIVADFAPIDLSRLISDGILPFEPVFFERGLTLESHIEDGIQITGSSSQLNQVLEILLDNAQKYSDAGGITHVSLIHSGRKHCRLTVSNQGPPIPPEKLSLMFERFYRADEARSRDGSFGLGLAIARSIVVQHHGKIWMESKNGTNTCFVEFS